VVTYKNDHSRSGQNLTETLLTLANVNSSSFGLRRFLSVDGKVDAQPLYLSSLTVRGATHNVVFVATENDSVYAFDADSGTTLWHVSLLLVGESTSDAHHCPQVTPTIGITATPVIDRSAGAHGVIFVVAMSRDASGNYHQRLHALDVTSGAEVFAGPVEIVANYPNVAGTTTFDPGQYVERAALLLLNGTIYTSFASHCDGQPYSGWVIAYNETTLARTAVLNVAPNSSHGPSIWMAGGGPAADAAGNIYLLTANGAFETTLDAKGFPSGQDYGDSFLKLSTAGGTLTIADYYTINNVVLESSSDIDLGSGGAMLLPDLKDTSGTVQHLMVGAGKDGDLYIVNRDSMGKFNPTTTSNVYQLLVNAVGGGIFSTPAWFNGTLYYGPVDASLLAFSAQDAHFAATPSSKSPRSFGPPGTAPAVSANGTANGIVWAHESANTAVLHAYDAGNLAHELYNSSQAPNGRDHFGAGNKFITPTIADGKVFIGIQSGVAVFGLLN